MGRNTLMKSLNSSTTILFYKRVECLLLAFFLFLFSLKTSANESLDDFTIRLNGSEAIVKASEKNGIYYILNEKDEADYSLGNNSEIYPLENNKSKYESVKNSVRYHIYSQSLKNGTFLDLLFSRG